MWYRVFISGFGNVYIQAASPEDAKAQGAAVGAQQGVPQAQLQGLTAIPTSQPNDGYVFQGGRLESTTEWRKRAFNTGTGSPTEEQNNPSGFAPQNPVGPALGGGDPNDQPDDVPPNAGGSYSNPDDRETFNPNEAGLGPQPDPEGQPVGEQTPGVQWWRVNLGGEGQDVYFYGDRNQAVEAARKFAQNEKLSIDTSTIGGDSTYGATVDEIKGKVQIGQQGQVSMGREGSWLDPTVEEDNGFNPNPESPTKDTGEGGENLAGYGQTGITVTPEQADPYGAYLNLLRAQGVGPQDQYQQSLYGQRSGAFQIHKLLDLIGSDLGDQTLEETYDSTGTANDPGGFIEYLMNTSEQGRAQQSLQALQQVGSGQLGAADFDDGGSPLSVLALLQSANPNAGGYRTMAASDLGQAALQALGNELPAFVRQRYGQALLSQTNDLYAQNLARHAGTGEAAPTYVNALLSYLGLGQ